MSGSDGVQVGRRWLPWRRRMRVIRPSTDTIDLGMTEGGGVDDLALGVAIMVVAILLPTLITGVIAIVEVAGLALLVPLTALGRIVFRRPWRLEVRRRRADQRWQMLHEEDVVGWRASQLRLTELRQLFGASSRL